jgi:DUF4097 and DUF4098 domain-containing protein YvlB
VQEPQGERNGLEAPRQTGRNRRLWIAVAVAAVLACICVLVAAVLLVSSVVIWDRDLDMSGLRHEDTEEHIVQVPPGTRLEVDNFAGAIEVSVGSDGQFHVVAIKSGPSGTDLQQIQVQVERVEGAVVVRTLRPGSRSNVNVRLEIRAPADTGLDLHTGAGNVEVQGFAAGVDVDTGSGSVTARGLVGTVDLSTGSGSIEAQDVSGRFAIDSGSGSLTVQGLSGDLEAHTGSGGIDVLGAEGNVRLETGSGSVTYRGVPAGECRFETGTGSVALYLPAELDFRIQAETGSGSVDVRFPVEGRVSRQYVEGIVGTGQEATLVASTGSGGIDVFQD